MIAEICIAFWATAIFIGAVVYAGIVCAHWLRWLLS
jgi:hypothetical protein